MICVNWYVHSSRCIHGISMCPPSSKLVFFAILNRILAMWNLVAYIISSYLPLSKQWPWRHGADGRNSEKHQSKVYNMPINIFFFISSIIILISEVPQFNRKKYRSEHWLIYNAIYRACYKWNDQISLIYYYSQ